VDLAQLVRFLVVELTHPSSNPRFDINVAFTLIILSVEGNIPVDSETLFVTDFMNLKIKSTQSFECTHRSKVCVHVFTGVSAHTCMSTVFIKK
jgi:hypothetical protein